MTKIDSQQNSKEPHLHPKAAAEVLAALDRVEGEDLDRSDLPRIDGFQISQSIASGGGGTVYLAFRDHSDQPLAIKVMHPRLGKTNASKRAWRELDFLREIRHPSIPRLLDHGESDGHIYLVTEFIDGTPLDRYCNTHELELRKRVDLLARAADVVQFLHEFGIIHRDIKPGNILIDPDEQPVLIDLGIATLFDLRDLETLTLVGEPIGSPVCMAPEQARGERESISTRSDVYGLGATAYLLLTGQPPHDVDVPLHEVARRIGNDEPRDPLELKPSLPKSLACVLRKAVAFEPSDRYASATELGDDFRRWSRREPVEAGSPTIHRRTIRLLSRHPIWVTSGICLLVVILTLLSTLFSVWWLNNQPFKLVVDTNRSSWARLVARSGRSLHEWDTKTNNLIFAEDVQQPDMFGGRRMILIAFKYHSNPDYDRRLCTFDWNEPERLIWSHGKQPPDLVMPEPISTNKGNTFRPTKMLVADVFDESPGEEIIALFRIDLWSATVVQILDLNGSILFEFWHDGVLEDAYWDEHDGLLYICGVNSEVKWTNRGIHGLQNVLNPVVIFAVRPELGRIHREWVHTPGGKGTFEVEWYRCLMPPEQLDRITQGGVLCAIAYKRENTSDVDAIFWQVSGNDTPRKFIWFALNADGQLVDRMVSDPYSDDPSMPDPKLFRVSELPRIMAIPPVTEPGDE